jgi:hypothetical protein
MPGVTGREMKAVAFAKCGTNSWNVAASVTKGARFDTDGGLRHAPSFIEDNSFGETFRGSAEPGDVAPPEPAFSGQARYEDYNYILEALAMGSPAAVAISASAAGQTTSWSHVIDVAPSIDGLCATFAMDRKLYVEELTSAKIYGFGETYGGGGVIMQSFRTVGSKATHISSVNINSTVHGASYPALNGRIQRSHGTFRLNAQGGSGLASGDAIPVEGLEFSFERPQDRTHASGSPYIIEPADNDFPMVSFRVTFPRMNTISANSLRTAINSYTAYKADWTCLGAFINSTDRYTALWQFPYVELQDFATPTAGAAQVKPTALFVAKKPSAAPTGMTGVVNPVRRTRIMTNSVHAFA